MPTLVPAQFRDLLDRPIVVILCTILPDGQPHATPVWCDYVIEDGADGPTEYIRINSADGRQKVRDMEERPKVTVAVVDPDDDYRWLEVRGTVDVITAEGAEAHINTLCKAYTGHDDYYAWSKQKAGGRIMFKIRPFKVAHSH
jgi:PPOX class probable F420-dependent enzyme